MLSLYDKESSLSAWLTALPIMRDNFNLTPIEFEMLYVSDTLNHYYRCHQIVTVVGQSSQSLMHLTVKKGDWSLKRHKVRDLLYDLSAIVWNQTVKEPVIREATSDQESLIGDISARGVWQPQATAVFDIRVIDSDAPSYLSKPVESVLTTAEREKLKYNAAVSLDIPVLQQLMALLVLR